MKTEIIVAIIGAIALVVSSIIGGIFSHKKKNSDKNTIIQQKQKGKNNTQIGIQNNYGETRNE